MLFFGFVFGVVYVKSEYFSISVSEVIICPLSSRIILFQLLKNVFCICTKAFVNLQRERQPAGGLMTRVPCTYSSSYWEGKDVGTLSWWHLIFPEDSIWTDHSWLILSRRRNQWIMRMLSQYIMEQGPPADGHIGMMTTMMSKLTYCVWALEDQQMKWTEVSFIYKNRSVPFF